LEPVRDALEKNAALMFGPTVDGGEPVSPVPQLPGYEIGKN
jgi:hypothetical protein